MSNPVSGFIHPGVVQECGRGLVRVRIASQSACGSCQSKTVCGMSEMQEKIVEVQVRDSSVYHPGQSVKVSLDKRLGFRALWLAYLLPFLIMVGLVVISLQLGGGEPLAALAALTGLGIYFTVLYRFRLLLRKRFHFTISPE